MNKLNIHFNYNFLLLPNKCSIREGDKDCVNPPEYLITIVSDNDEFMIGITCEKHKESVSLKISSLQNDGKIPTGTVKFEKLKYVQTDCIRGYSDDLIQLYLLKPFIISEQLKNDEFRLYQWGLYYLRRL